jgi:hypothetical protein
LTCAVLRDEDSAEPTISGRDRSWVDSILKEWGEWIWENRDYEGYPSADAIANFVNGAGGSMAGHRIICRDPPEWVTMTHVLVMMLPESLGAAVFAEFVPGVDENGLMLSRAERCERIGVNDETFRKRLQRARAKIVGWSRARGA